MGAAFTIDAPLPPIPESPIPIGEGRCPRNPIWTTRFPGGQEKWWPVNHPGMEVHLQIVCTITFTSTQQSQ